MWNVANCGGIPPELLCTVITLVARTPPHPPQPHTPTLRVPPVVCQRLIRWETWGKDRPQVGRTAGEEIGRLGGKLSPHDPERWQSPQRSPEKPWTRMRAHVQLQTGGLVAFKGSDTVGCSQDHVCRMFVKLCPPKQICPLLNLCFVCFIAFISLIHPSLEFPWPQLCL